MGDYSKKFATKLKPFLTDKTFTVSEFIDFINGLLEPLKLCKVMIRGEIGEDIYVNEKNGWVIFNLIDQEKSELGCFGLSYVVDRMGVEIRPGLEVKITGYPQLRKKKGRFSFQVERINPVGEGDLKKQFEILKKRLDEEGFFDPKKKKSIPQLIKRVGLITSKGSDAEKDFLTHLKDYGFEVFKYSSRVEGDAAVDGITEGIKILNRNYSDLEALVITRGGGSWESLQAFNSEELVKAAFASRIPVISAIGHENDVTLLDMVADKRVSTPTDAGKFLSESWEEAERRINDSEKNLSASIKKIVSQMEKRFLEQAAFFERRIKRILSEKEKDMNYFLNSLTDKIERKIDKFHSLEKEFESQSYKIKIEIKKKKEKVINFYKDLQKNKLRWEKTIEKYLLKEDEKLNLSSPDLKLKQGYSITKLRGKILKSVNDLSAGEVIETTLVDGVVESRVKENEQK